MQILFADKFSSKYLARITSLGNRCVLEPDLSAEGLPESMTGVEALVVRSTRVNADAFGAADALRLVIRAGAGTNTIDKQTAADHGVYVCNVPGRNAVAVAELTLGLILAIDRNIPDNVIDIRQRRWDKKRYSEARGLYGRAIGIVGTGAIGLAVAERTKAFGLQIRVLAKPGRSPGTAVKLEALGVEYEPDLLSLAANCDILTFHVPAAAETKGLIGAELLDRVKPGTVIINTSRGDVVDEAALIKAMDEKGVRAGLDVYDAEPGSGQGEFDSALAAHANVYGTHHIGASTTQAQDAVAEGVVEILTAFAGGDVLHCVNGLTSCRVTENRRKP